MSRRLFVNWLAHLLVLHLLVLHLLPHWLVLHWLPHDRLAYGICLVCVLLVHVVWLLCVLRLHVVAILIDRHADDRLATVII